MDKIEKLRTFLISTPDDSFLKHALALEYIKTGDDNRARTLFMEILTHDPSYIGTYYHLGRLMERAGESENAKSWFARGMAAAIRVDDKHSYNELKAALEELTD